MSSNYSAGKEIPGISACGKSVISLSFNGRVLTMAVGGKVAITYGAVSGRANDKGLFDYSVSRQNVGSEGPIPNGRYWIQPSRMWTNHRYNLAPNAAWDSHRIAIHAYPGTQTFGRGGFFIHGGTHAGNAGCINLHAAMESFIQDMREATKDAPDCYVPLTVRY